MKKNRVVFIVILTTIFFVMTGCSSDSDTISSTREWQHPGPMTVSEAVEYISNAIDGLYEIVVEDTEETDISLLSTAISRSINSVFILNLYNTVLDISDQAFYTPFNYSALDDLFMSSYIRDITLPKNCTSIGEQAFYNCGRLLSVEIPASCTSIGEQAFYNCGRLLSVEIPASCNFIGEQAFYNCYSLMSVKIEGSPDWYCSDCSDCCSSGSCSCSGDCGCSDWCGCKLDYSDPEAVAKIFKGCIIGSIER